MKLVEILIILANLSFFISILACFYMFIKYCRLPHKTFGAKMIITLCIADFLFHSGLVLKSYIEFSPIRILGAIFADVALRFSVFWSSCIALLLYKLLASDSKLQGPKYYRYCLCIVISLSVFLAFVSLYCEYGFDWKEMSSELIVKMISNISFVAALLLTLFYYVKSIRILKRNSTYASEATEESIRTICRYAFVQFITVGPKVIYSYLAIITGLVSPVVDTSTVILFGLTGFANSMVYFFKRDGFGASTESTINHGDTTMDDDLSYYEDGEDFPELRTHAK